MKMKNLLQNLFKKEPQSNFMATDFQEIKTYSSKKRKSANNSEYEVEEPAEIDEMQIDKIYQSL